MGMTPQYFHTIPTFCQLCLVLVSCGTGGLWKAVGLVVLVCSACAWRVIFRVAAECSCYSAWQIWSVLCTEAVKCMNIAGFVWHVRV